ncbi:MAG: aminotransferase class V-fold PLP-dependent enzyme [Candidatus Odinarchaeia archaeon]
MSKDKNYLTVEEVREHIPLTKNYIYLDSGATTPVPTPVIKKMEEYLIHYGANIERGAYSIANKATEEWEKAREDTARLLLNCEPDELIFTRNLTQASNIIAYALSHPKISYKNGELFIEEPLVNWSKNDEIVTTVVEHHSNLIVWMRLAKIVGVKFKLIKDLPPTGEITTEVILKNITEKTRFIALQHASNVFGTVNNVKEIVKEVKNTYPDCLIFIDGSQGPGHMPVDVKKINCDFYGFSGHKGPLGPPGTGGLYVKKDIISKLEPLEIGGGVIADVTYDTYKLRTDIPSKRFDAGTPNILGMIGLGEAARYVAQKIGLNRIKTHEIESVKYLIEELPKIKGLELYGPTELNKKTGVVTFNLEGWNSKDLSLALDVKWNILTRAGHHCALPAVKWRGIWEKYGGNVRISLHYFNTLNELEDTVRALKQLSEE